MEEYTIARQRRDFQGDLRIPLSTGTPPISTAYTPDSPQQSQQSQLLRRLPAEIRHMVWCYAVGNQSIRLVSKHRRVGHVVCNAEYWKDMNCERPGLRASSYLFTYGSLPTTKQLADWNMCHLLVASRQIYAEVFRVLYETNTFVFWDLRTIDVFKNSILPERWTSIRTIDVYAMRYREEDMADAIEARSRLQLEAWPAACAALATLPHVHKLRVFVANPCYLDVAAMTGNRANAYQACRAFLLQCKALSTKTKLELFVTGRRRVGSASTNALASSRWRLRTFRDSEVETLGAELKEAGVNCSTLIPRSRT
ncbi:hypothetical protein BDV95DRAFT_591038 [Massariosphaeria phaeospora]|uniref:DUF7730 domain-containing protein n=1 Tax=Massariosphaeria phaeospora TaxID=100035 RepID=A0A7C8MD76_9PLEO|nr:hypothetical protein BDV95DRAFT_591038 [Massariosphaeria phaeospora]